MRTELHEKWMREALKEAKQGLQKDEVPIGAVVVFDGRIIGRGYNQVEMLQDPTAHAEMIALTAATNTIGKKWLTGATMFVTVEPCVMCAGALILARLKELVYGIQEVKSGAHSTIFNLLDDPRVNHRIEVIPGVLASDCGHLLSSFFEELRKRN
ncbi:MAG: tRNA adenosine(34) deaminase TadA [Candidatus Kariarchaeaceae archaeon]|jgi:tRNA(adenine34) deaminase